MGVTMKWLLGLMLALLGFGTPPARAADYEPLDIRHWPNVVAAPDPSAYRVDDNLNYPSGGDLLPFALYRPKTSGRAPIVVIVNGIGDPPGDRQMNWQINRSWAALLAANGIAAVTMAAKTDEVDRNLNDLVTYLGDRGARLGIDAGRLALFSAAASTEVAGRFLQSPKGRVAVDCAVFYYGLPPAGDLPQNVPVMFVVAEGDMRTPESAAYAGLWQRVMASKAPWSLVFGASQSQAFDAIDQSPASRRIVAQTIDFLLTSLTDIAPARVDYPDERAVLRTVYNNDDTQTISVLKAYLARNPNSARARSELGQRLVEAKRYDEAEPVLRAADAGDGAAQIALSRLLMAKNKPTEAYEVARAAIDRGLRTSSALGQLGMAALAADETDVAIEAFRLATETSVARGTSFYNLACALALKGDKPAAVDALRAAFDNGYRNAGIMNDRDLAILRGDPGFQAIAAKIGAPVFR